MTWGLIGYRRALDRFERTLGDVTSDRWDAPSPCAAWTARDVCGHLTGGQHVIAALAEGRPPPEINADPGRFAGPDPAASWRAARTACAAMLTPAALSRKVPFGTLGQVPLEHYLGGHVLELLVHTWDLAQATGQAILLDGDLVHHAFATAHVIAPSLRPAGLLGPERPVRPGADERTRLLAFLGRRP